MCSRTGGLITVDDNPHQFRIRSATASELAMTWVSLGAARRSHRRDIFANPLNAS